MDRGSFFTTFISVRNESLEPKETPFGLIPLQQRKAFSGHYYWFALNVKLLIIPVILNLIALILVARDLIVNDPTLEMWGVLLLVLVMLPSALTLDYNRSLKKYNEWYESFWKDFNTSNK